MTSSLPRILLVEDNVNDRDLALAALEQNDLANDVVWVEDGQKALDYLYRQGAFSGRTDEQPIVVLLDIKMPKVDGIEVLERVKNDPKLRKLPIVMLTSSNEELDVAKSYDLGVNAYVVKPVVFTEFVRTIHDLSQFWAVTNQPPPKAA